MGQRSIIPKGISPAVKNTLDERVRRRSVITQQPVKQGLAPKAEPAGKLAGYALSSSDTTVARAPKTTVLPRSVKVDTAHISPPPAARIPASRISYAPELARALYEARARALFRAQAARIVDQRRLEARLHTEIASLVRRGQTLVDFEPRSASLPVRPAVSPPQAPSPQPLPASAALAVQTTPSAATAGGLPVELPASVAVGERTTPVAAGADTGEKSVSDAAKTGDKKPANIYETDFEAEKKAERSADPNELSQDEKLLVQKLQQRDRQVRAHEAAHLAAGGGVVRGGASFVYQNGPDGKAYAIGGEVPIDASGIPGDLEGTIRKMETVARAALAPADPSGTDIRVAASARAAAQKARAMLTLKHIEEANEALEQHRADHNANAGQTGYVGETEPQAGAHQFALNLVA